MTKKLIVFVQFYWFWAYFFSRFMFFNLFFFKIFFVYVDIHFLPIWWLHLYFCQFREFANGAGYWGSIPGRVIPKTQKWYLMLPCLTLGIIIYGSRVKWSNLENGVAPSPTPRWSSYWKGSLWVTWLRVGWKSTFLKSDPCLP